MASGVVDPGAVSGGTSGADLQFRTLVVHSTGGAGVVHDANEKEVGVRVREAGNDPCRIIVSHARQ